MVPTPPENPEEEEEEEKEAEEEEGPAPAATLPPPCFSLREKFARIRSSASMPACFTATFNCLRISLIWFTDSIGSAAASAAKSPAGTSKKAWIRAARAACCSGV
jgi:hypothetical protein